MSTRSQIGIFLKSDYKPESPKFRESLLYRHSDGYPGDLETNAYGVLTCIVPFLREFMECRGWDSEYLSAQLLFEMIRQSKESSAKWRATRSKDKEETEAEKKETARFDREMDFLGYGISSDFHGDIEFFYALYPINNVTVGIDVYEIEGFLKAKQKFHLIESYSVDKTGWKKLPKKKQRARSRATGIE